MVCLYFAADMTVIHSYCARRMYAADVDSALIFIIIAVTLLMASVVDTT